MKEWTVEEAREVHGNARGMRNLFDSIIEIQANRAIEEGENNFDTITIEDVFELTKSKIGLKAV